MKCTATTKSVGFFRTEKNRINTNPPYQRESGAWSNDKKQLLIDSLLNYFDTPKIYLHDLYDEKDEYIKNALQSSIISSIDSITDESKEKLSAIIRRYLLA